MEARPFASIGGTLLIPSSSGSAIGRASWRPLSWRRSAFVMGVAATCAWLGSAATPSLLLVASPRAGTVVGLEGVDVIIRFPRDRSVALDSLRVRLNGADVTDRFTKGSNGAVAQLFETLDGENSIQIEVMGDRGGLPGRQLGDFREVWFLVRHPIDLDRG